MEVLIDLRQANLITENELDLIYSKTTNQEKNYELTTLLAKKEESKLGYIILETFCKAGNSNLVSEIVKSSNLVIPKLQCENTYKAVLPKRTILPNQTKYVLDGKWWPEKKYLVKPFYNRKLSNGKPLVEKLHEMLNENRTAVITQDAFVVSDLGGIGKTSIAKSFATTYENEYHHIIWIDCGEGSLTNSFRSLAIDLNVEIKIDQLNDLANGSFSKLGTLNCLLIFDNAECYLGTKGIRDVLPNSETNPNLHSLITSRDQEWGTYLGQERFTTFSVNVFSREESNLFLRNAFNASINCSKSNLEKLAELLGHLPLALQIAVATLNKSPITLDEYIQLIAADNNFDMALKMELDDYERTINKTMKISLDQIKRDKNGENAYTVLMTLGYTQPDDVKFLFLSDIIHLKVMDVKQSVTLLENYSLVTVEKKKGSGQRNFSEFVSIHRLVQQVIRHIGRDIEKNILSNILSVRGKAKYKLFPYTYIAKHKELQEKFAHVKSEIVGQLKLTDVIDERRFSEAVYLALFIHQSFKDHDLKYFTSKYNYAVCLEKANQKDDSMKVFNSLFLELSNQKNQEKLNDNEIGIMELQKYWTIDNNNPFVFDHKLLSLKDKIPKKNIIGICTKLVEYIGKTEFVVQACTLFSALNLKGPLVNEEITVDNLVAISLFSVILLDNTKAFSAINGFLEGVPECRIKFSNIAFSKWLNFTEYLVKAATKLAPQLDIGIEEILIKLFLVAKRLMFCIKSMDFQNNAEKCSPIATALTKIFDFYFEIQATENSRYTLCKVINDLYVFVYDEQMKPPFSQRIIISQGWYSDEKDEVCLLSKLSCNGSFSDVFSTQIQYPDSLTSITLERMTIYMPLLISSIVQCSNLVEILLKDIRFWGECIYKIDLPSLKRFEIVLADDNKHLDLTGIDYFTFFCGQNSCIWDAISRLEYYHITNYKLGTIMSDRMSQKLILCGSSMPNFHQNFTDFQTMKRYFQNNFVGSSNVCYCSNCIENSNISQSVGMYCSAYNSTVPANTIENVAADQVKFLTGSVNIMSDEKAFSAVVSCNIPPKLTNLNFLKIDDFPGVLVNLIDLCYIKIIEISRTKVHCSQQTITETSKGAQQFTRCQKLTLFSVILIDFEGIKTETIDLTALNIKELIWIQNCTNYYLMLDRLPSTIEKLTVKNVRLKFNEGASAFSNSVDEMFHRDVFRNNFQNLSFIKICHWETGFINLRNLDTIRVIELTEVKVCCSQQASNSGNKETRLFQPIHKLTLICVILVDCEGKTIDTIDLSNLNVKELIWSEKDTYYYVIFDRLPLGIEKLTLEYVGLKLKESGNAFSNSITEIDNGYGLKYSSAVKEVVLVNCNIINSDSYEFFPTKLFLKSFSNLSYLKIVGYMAGVIDLYTLDAIEFIELENVKIFFRKSTAELKGQKSSGKCIKLHLVNITSVNYEGQILPLNLSILPQSLKVLLLYDYQLEDTQLENIPFYLEKLIFDNFSYAREDIYALQVCLRSLLCRTKTLFIRAWNGIDEHFIKSLPCNVKGLFLFNKLTDQVWRFELLDESKGWNLKEAVVKASITSEEFEKLAYINKCGFSFS